MKSEILKLKLELKNLAKSIRIQKNKRCAKNNGYVDGLNEMRKYYRHRHVLYCLARGRTLDQVDSGVGLDMKYIEFQLEAMKGDKKLYVIVANNLGINVQAVQACHAVAEFMKRHPATMWKNGTLILLKGEIRSLWRYGCLPYEFAEAEKIAGFSSIYGDKIATSGFSHYNKNGWFIQGKIEYEGELDENKHHW